VLRSVDFKLDLTSQNRLVRLGLHPLIYYETALSLIDLRLPTHPLTPRYIHHVCGTWH